jgi:hypothetical protein
MFWLFSKSLNSFLSNIFFYLTFLCRFEAFLSPQAQYSVLRLKNDISETGIYQSSKIQPLLALNMGSDNASEAGKRIGLPNCFYSYLPNCSIRNSLQKPIGGRLKISLIGAY